ncbi:hypothetical protein [Halorussus lipolyticus]|uniref:hypothetical protein n=1 Tax=Halorussus lipolyticus TaxID=3034024 RepID=UPI0023E7A144|nr:hypothetical protein [Halorussus sp. DT80]
MNRRPFLHAAFAGAAAAATGGYLGVLGGSEEDPDESNRRATSPAASDPEALSVRRVETFDHVVRLNALGDDPRGGISSVSALSDREREVVAAALSGGYETDDPPEWLAEFASGTPFVERSGTYYRLDDTFPTYRVTAEAVPAGEVEGDVATYDEYERAVTREEYVMSGLLRVARREAVELGYVWPSLRGFFENYAAARYHGEVVAFSVAVEDAGPPFRLSASEVPVSEAAGGPVWRADAASAAVREIVRRAGQARGAYGFNRAPPGLLDALREHRYVLLGGTFYTSYVESRGSPRISVSAEVRDGLLRLAARNRGDSAVRLSSGAPRPFGVVRCRPKGGSDGDSGSLLWTDAYAESDHVRTEGRAVELASDVAVVSTLAPAEEVAETYAVPDLPAGEYVVAGSLGGTETGDDSANDDRDSTVRYRVAFSVG